MARLYTELFESGTSGWTTTNGSPSIVTTQAYTGTHSLRCNPAGTFANISKTCPAVPDTGGNTMYLRAYIRIASAPNATVSVLCWADSPTATTGHYGLRLKSDRTLIATSSSGTTGTASSALALNTWYRIEIEYSDNANTLKGYLDGVNFSGTVTGAGLGGGAYARVGLMQNVTADVFFDEFAVNDSTTGTDNGLPGAVATGTTYNETPADAEGLTDSVGTVQTGRSTLPDALGASDSVSTSISASSTLADAQGLTDSLTTAVSAGTAPADPIGMTDSITVARIITPIVVDDALGLVDNISSAVTATNTLADGMGIADTLISAVSGTINLDDALGGTESLDAIDPNDGPLSLEESLELHDSTTVALSQASALSETAGTTDFITITLGYWEADHVPHSSAGFGEIYIDRFFLVEKEKASESNDGKMDLAGQESSPPTTPALVRFLHGQVNGIQRDKVVPVIFRDKASRNAYYSTGDAACELNDYQGEIVTADWTLSLTRLGSASEVDLQSRLTGAVRQNDFSLTGQRWHAPAIGHYAYFTGTTNPSTITRTTSDGAMTVYMDIPTGIQPKWGCAVESYHTGRVRITDTLEVSIENEVEGLNRSISSSGWAMSNGLVNITPTATAGVINIANYNGTSFIDKLVNITVGGTTTGNRVAAWDAATILRNDMEQGIMRLTGTLVSGGRVSLDIGLRRGSRAVECRMQTSTATTLSAHCAASESNQTTTSSAGYVTRSTDGTGGLRFVVGSPRTFTAHANGGVTKASTTSLDFFFGATVAAGGTNDTAIALRNQYIASMPEHTYCVRR